MIIVALAFDDDDDDYAPCRDQAVVDSARVAYPKAGEAAVAEDRVLAGLELCVLGEADQAEVRYSQDDDHDDHDDHRPRRSRRRHPPPPPYHHHHSHHLILTITTKIKDTPPPPRPPPRVSDSDAKDCPASSLSDSSTGGWALRGPLSTPELETPINNHNHHDDDDDDDDDRDEGQETATPVSLLPSQVSDSDAKDCPSSSSDSSTGGWGLRGTLSKPELEKLILAHGGEVTASPREGKTAGVIAKDARSLRVRAMMMMMGVVMVLIIRADDLSTPPSSSSFPSSPPIPTHYYLEPSLTNPPSPLPSCSPSCLRASST
jgi:hypothetical protein